MKFDKKFKREVEGLISRGIKRFPLPQTKGKDIVVGSMLVRKTPQGYTVVKAKDNRAIAQTQHKMSALALAKSLAVGGKSQQKILELDKKLEKLSREIKFYAHTMKNNNDTCSRFSAETRYEICQGQIAQIKQILNRHIRY